MSYKIISGRYETGTAEQQAGYKMLFGEDNIQYKFDFYFHWYNIIHELGHCVVAVQDIEMSRIQEEMFVNEFAVAYWKYRGKEALIKELEDMLKAIISTMPCPVTPNMTFTEYYESIWETEAITNVVIYGYFQLNSVLKAIEANKDFETVLNALHIHLTDNPITDMQDGPICAENAHQVLHNALTVLHASDMNPLQISLELIENPITQCAEIFS